MLRVVLRLLLVVYDRFIVVVALVKCIMKKKRNDGVSRLVESADEIA